MRVSKNKVAVTQEPAIRITAPKKPGFETIYRECKDCGQRFPIYAGQQQYAVDHETFELPKRCHKCREVRKGFADREIVCKRCGKTFQFTKSEQKFYHDNNLVDPIRCTDCRKLKHAERPEENKPQ